jgi:type II secretory pathway component GspD/PulD (secretin)
LEHAAAQSAQETVETFFDEREGLGTKIRVIADVRSNSLIVQASPRDLAEVAAMIEKLDVGDSAAVNEIRLIKLAHTLAADLQPVLEGAISGDTGGQQANTERSAALRFVTVDAEGERLLKSGILTDVRITADENSNALLVSAPAASMPLLEALVEALDQLPAAEAQIKVFTIVEGDATTMMEMLETLFGQQTGGQQALQTPVRTGAVEGESSLVQLRFAVDARTNSIIASGSVGDLSVVEAILLRLDESDVRDRKTTVVRLNNAPAEDVSTAVNEYLNSQRQLEQIEEGLSVFEQMEREVIVVPEVVSNTLIVSATPKYFDDIMELVEQLDQAPPMVMIQVLIAEIQLSDTDEFGVELGLQDSILFDRSLLGNIVTTTDTVFDSVTGLPVSSTQVIQSATIDPGFLFNSSDPLGNSGASNAVGNADVVGSQGLSNFAVGRLNSELGFGGLVLSASSEAVNILIRALQEKRRVDILSRPQVMTLDNQPAFVMVGQRVPRITGVSTTQVGQTNQIITENVGLILTVTPRISPEGTVVMEIDVDKSELGPEAEGIPVSISEGQVIRSPRVNTTTAQTTISASDGQTVLLGGLITKNKSTITRRVPGLADIPILGHLFRYDNLVCKRTELLIIMTPHIVDSKEDAEWILQSEAERMHWCLCDIAEFPETAGLRSRHDEWSDTETTTIYPEDNPKAKPVPAPALDLEKPPTTQSGRRLPTTAPAPEQKAKRWWGPSRTVNPASYQARETARPDTVDRAAGAVYEPPRTSPPNQSFQQPSGPAEVGLGPFPPLDGPDRGVGSMPPATMRETSRWWPPAETVAPATYQPGNPSPTGTDQGVLPAYDMQQTAWPPQVRAIAPPRGEAAPGWPRPEPVRQVVYPQPYSTPRASITSVTPSYDAYRASNANVAGPVPQAPAYYRPESIAERQPADSPFLDQFYRIGSRPSSMAGGYIDGSGRRLY